MKLFLKCCNLCLFRFSKCTLSLKTYCCLMPNIISCQTRIKPFQPMCMQARINAAAAGAGTKLTLLKIFCVRTLTLKLFYFWSLICRLPTLTKVSVCSSISRNRLENTNYLGSIRADLANGKYFTKTVKKKFTSGSKISLDLTVCKKRCVQKTST